MTPSNAIAALRRIARSVSVEDAEAIRFAADSLEHALQPELPGLPAFRGIEAEVRALIRGATREDEPWTEQEDLKMMELRRMKYTRREVAHALGRTPKAIERREDRLTVKPVQMGLLV